MRSEPKNVVVLTDKRLKRTGQYEVFKSRFVLTGMHYQPELFRTSLIATVLVVVMVMELPKTWMMTVVFQ